MKSVDRRKKQVYVNNNNREEKTKNNPQMNIRIAPYIFEREKLNDAITKKHS
jgi:hypothetical protein